MCVSPSLQYRYQVGIMLIGTGLWRNRDDARHGGTGPWHRQARTAARELYERIEFRTMELVVEDGGREWSMASIA